MKGGPQKSSKTLFLREGTCLEVPHRSKTWSGSTVQDLNPKLYHKPQRVCLPEIQTKKPKVSRSSANGFVNLSDRALKENVRAIPEEELQQIFDAVEPQLYDRIDGGKEQIGFVAQDVQASGKLGATMCKTKTLDGRELMALDYQKLSVVLWGVVKKLQKRVEALEKKKKRKGDSD